MGLCEGTPRDYLAEPIHGDIKVMATRAAIGVDYDGTIADTNGQKMRWIREHCGIDIESYQCDRSACVPIIGQSRYDGMAATVYERKWTLRSQPVAGVLAALYELNTNYDIFIITARLPHRMAFAREWLEANECSGLIKDVLTSAGEDEEPVCLDHGVSVLIDDDPRHLLPITSSSLRPLLLKVGSNSEQRNEIKLPIYQSWREILDVLPSA